VSVIEVVEDLIALQRLAGQERDAARRRSLDAVREHVAERDSGAKVGEAAQVLGVSAPTVRAWIVAGALRRSVRTTGSVQDVYELLLAAVAVEVPDQERTKRPCCDELGEPPADAALAGALAAAVSALAPGRRGRR
jgi:predicted transcriptional regulator